MPAQLCKSFDCKFETAYGLLLLCFSVVLIETIGGLRSCSVGVIVHEYIDVDDITHGVKIV